MNHLIEDLLLLSKFETSDAQNRQQRVSIKVLMAGLRQDAEALNSEKKTKFTLSWKRGDLLGSEQQLRSAFQILWSMPSSTPKREEKFMSIGARCAQGESLWFRTMERGLTPYISPPDRAVLSRGCRAGCIRRRHWIGAGYR